LAENRKRVLIVDDDPEIIQLVRVLLSRLEIEVISAITAAEAAQILKTPPLPEIFILDLMLPEVSGMDLLKQMRAKTTFDDLPVIVLSALIDPNQIREALDAGADRYLTKPYIANNLISVVGELLKTGRRRPS
jgi:DNA-binding response OmpR family regulator